MPRCSDCAFTPGTQANASTWTQLTTELCLLAREPFYCHAKGAPEPVCAGFIEALAKASEEPEWRRKLARRLLDLQQIASTNPEMGDAIAENFEECLAAMEDC